MKFPKNVSPLLHHIQRYAQSVFIPIVLIFASVIFTANSVKLEVNNSNKASVELVRATLDSTFQELSDTMRVVGANPDLSRYQLLSDPMGSISAIKDIIDAHSSLDDLILFVRDVDQFCSGSGSFDMSALPSKFFSTDFLSGDGAIETWLNLMHEVSSPIYWAGPSNSQSAYLFLITPVYYPLQYNGSIATRTASLVIKQDYIKNIFLSSQTASEESMLLLSSDCVLLSKLTSRETDPYVSDICEYINNNPDVFRDGFAELPGSNILLFVTRSSETGLRYVRFLPKAVAYSSLHAQALFSIVSVLIILLVGFLLTVSRFRRDRQALGASSEEQPVLHTEESSGDAPYTPPAIFRPDSADHLLTDLLSGSLLSEAECRKACQILNVHPDKPYYAVCSLLVEENRSDTETGVSQKITAAIASCMPACYQVLTKELLSAGKLILVVCSSSNDPESCQAAVSALKDHLLEQEQLAVSIGMSYFYDSPEKISSAYKDSVAALDYRLVYGKNCLITPDIYASSSPEISSSYPTYDLILLDSSISSHNAEMALTVLRRINAIIKLKNYNLHIAENICNDIFSILKKNPDFADITAAYDPARILESAAPAEHKPVDDYFDSLSALIVSKLTVPDKPEPLAQTDIGAQLLEYVDAHCLSYDFQIKNMAERFSISPQYMRKLFKAHSGISVSEYVTNKRLEKAMHLLSSTDMNLQDIVSEIGNSDISGFVRFFKQKTGMTPGQFRKAQKEQD